ncbi:MAG: PA2779 family protein [Halioglobus sp.]
MKNAGKVRGLNHSLVFMLVLLSLFAGHAQAKMLSTDAVINAGSGLYSQQQLQTALASDELQQQLAELGVDAKQLNDRIASLTPEEIQQLNAELAQQPAGGIVGVLLTIFIVFVITDMLCATDIFSFVKCIN